MSDFPLVTFYHSPNTRSSMVLTLFEELDVPFDLRVLNFKTGEQRQAAYLAINPMGKVPAIVHDGALVTELPAVFIYLADLYPQAGLAPAIGDPLRGPFLRWLVFYGSCFEPAIIDRTMNRDPAPMSTSPYGDFDSVVRVIGDQLARAPYLLGERFTAADVLWGSALAWMLGFGLIAETPTIRAYVDRVAGRPAAARAKARDTELAASQG